MPQHLGKTATDKITGFTGIIIGFCCYLTGCNQYLVQPKADKSGKVEESRWFDEQRLTINEKVKPVVLDNSTVRGFDKPAPRR